MSREQQKKTTMTTASQGQNNTTKGDNNHSSSSDSSSSSSPTTPTSEKVTEPWAPDGGWGWVVVLSSFVISVLVDGVCFSVGVFFTPFRDFFGSSKAQTAWVGSVLNGTYLCIGPLVGAFVNRFGCKKVTMVGAVIATSAFFLSTFAPNIPLLIFIYGCLGGIGFGFVYLPAMVMVSYYFKQRRALATGIACCGSGIGAFVFAPLCNWLLEVYDWKGATWILSGLVLHGMIFANFYRPLEIPEEEEGQEGDSSEQTQPLLARDDGRQDGEGSPEGDSGTGSQTDPGCSFQTGGEAVRLVQVVDGQGKIIFPQEVCIEVTPPGDDSLATSSPALPAEKGEQASPNVTPECKDTDRPEAEGSENLPPVRLRDSSSRTKNYRPERPLSDVIRSVTPHITPMDCPESKTFRSDVLHRKLVDPLARLAFSHNALSDLRVRKPHVTAHPHPHHSSHRLYAAASSPLLRKDIFYTGSLRNIPEHHSSRSLAEYRRRVTELEKKKEEEEEKGEEGKKVEEEEEEGKVSALCAPLLEVFDISLLRSPSFLIYCFSCFLCMLGFFVPFIYLPTLCSDLGMPPSRGAFLISIIGITNTVGRVVAGFVSDQPWADCLLINNVALIIGGVTTCCVPFFPVHYAVFAVYTALFGTCIAVFVALRSIIMVELLGLDRLTSAFGLVIMCQGISTYIGAPIAGMLSDLTGDYNISFYTAGFFIAVSGLLCLPLRRILRWELSRQPLITDPEKCLDVPGDVTDDVTYDATDDVKCDTEALTSRHSED